MARSTCSARVSASSWAGGGPIWSREISRIILDPGLAEHVGQFVAERSGQVVLPLVSDVPPNRGPRGGADGERRVPLLPCERADADGLLNPDRGRFFHLPDEVRQAMSG